MTGFSHQFWKIRKTLFCSSTQLSSSAFFVGGEVIMIKSPTLPNQWIVAEESILSQGMDPKESLHALEINPSPTVSSPTDCTGHITVTMFRGPSSILCRFPSYQSLSIFYLTCIQIPLQVQQQQILEYSLWGT